ncbi:MAG: hypothetical protein QXG00_02060 [Candidatus Woesearchaeota archaeon]
MNLTDWTVNYVKHKDLILKNLISFNVKQKIIEFIFKDRIHDYFIEENLKIENIRPIYDKNTNHQKTIVCIHKKDNFNFLIENWSELVKQNVTYIFVNIEHNDKLIINPMLHNKIADQKSLIQGLKTMFDAAEGKIVTNIL